MRELIKGLFLFDGVDFDGLNVKYGIIERVTEEKYEKDDVVSINADKDTKGIYILADGSADIVKTENGKNVILRHITSGDTYGAATLFPDSTNNLTSIVCDVDVTLIKLDSDLVRELIKEPDVAENYICFLSDRVSFLNKRIATFTAGSADDKVLEYLHTLPFRDGKYTLEVSYSDLCKVLNLGRASLYRAFDSLEEKGVLKREGKTLKILKDRGIEK